jgi:hypothetical protein
VSLGDDIPGYPGVPWFAWSIEDRPTLTATAVAVLGRSQNGSVQGGFRLGGAKDEAMFYYGEPGPGVGGSIEGGGQMAGAGERVAFEVELGLADGTRPYVFLQHEDRSIEPVIGVGEYLEGRPVTGLFMTIDALGADRLVINALVPGDWALWEADLGPGPSALEIPAVGGWGLGTFAVVVACAALLGLRSRRRAVPPLPSP